MVLAGMPVPLSVTDGDEAEPTNRQVPAPACTQKSTRLVNGLLNVPVGPTAA